MKRWITGILGIMLALLAGAAGMWHNRLYTLKGVSDALKAEDGFYLIDNEGENFDFFHIDESGTIMASIREKKLDGEWWSSYYSLTSDSKGGVYVYGYRVSMEDKAVDSAVYRCDFDSGKLVRVWTLPEQKMMKVQVQDGHLYYAAEDEGAASFYCQDQNGTVVKVRDIPIPYGNVRDVHYDLTNDILFVTDYHGKIYEDTEYVWETEEDKNDHAHISLGDRQIIFTDISDGGVWMVNTETEEEKKLFDTDHIDIPAEGLEYSDVLPLQYDEYGRFTAGVDMDGNHRVFGWFDENGQCLLLRKTLNKSVRLLAADGILFVLAAASAEAVVAFGMWFFYGYMHMMPVIVKLLGILLPAIFAASFFLSQRIEEGIRKKMVYSDYNLLYMIGEAEMKSADVDSLNDILLTDIPDGSEYKRVLGAVGEQDVNSKEALRTVIDGESGKENIITVKSYQWIYLQREGNLRYVVADDCYYGARVDYYRDRQQMELMKKAMEEKKLIQAEYNDQEGNWLVIYIPIEDSSSHVLGVMESGMSLGMVLYQMEQQMKMVHLMIGIIMAVLAGVSVLLLVIFLRPLGRLKRAVSSMTEGNLGVTLKVCGHDEIAGVTAAFNEMSERLKEQMDWIQQCADGYEKFVPEQIFRILNRKTIIDVQLGDQKSLTAAVAVMKNSGFRTMTHKADGQEIYDGMNQFLRQTIPFVNEKNGVVDQITEDEITAFFENGGKNALDAAILACEKNRGNCRAALSYGQIRVGIVGEVQRTAVATISRLGSLNEFLQETGKKYGAQILVTGTLAEQVEDFKTSYHSRLLGYVYIEKEDRMEPVYDVYDGEGLPGRREKEETSELFEKALSDFLSGRYYEARQKFAAVLRQSKNDLAARSYAYRCDRYCQNGGEERNIFLERY
ncbi:HAMP domain-containing protein [Clostridium sp. AM58-1XD]|uniref:HAMP domain-containing protein n=1 Tax=Clostridium sp. AM58-1XD TaxID=2292307 RepID=UPI000E50B538|nr:HAMP domain-containing protein [Clostridium sp. AM58-1XD]RGY98558.1 HAMP domain-containing protein [Clostridium sp. AM58-1XD]